MASMGDSVKAPRCGPAAPYDKRRTRDFYRYYLPHQELAAQEPTWTNLHDDEAVARHKPVSSPDPALTAFCQLVAQKLNVRRAMIFLFDANYGYIVAESTRTLSLRDHDRHEDGDELWLGHARIPRGYSVCEHTVNFPPNPGYQREAPSPNGLAHIINDLTEDARFCNRPFVTDGPRLRFYAGVPLTTPRGHNIGALCALHDEPRGFDAEDLDLLLDLSGAVMSHFVTIRANFESRRRSAMFASLSAFSKHVNALREDLQWVDLSATRALSVSSVGSEGDELSDQSLGTALEPASRSVSPSHDSGRLDIPTLPSDGQVQSIHNSGRVSGAASPRPTSELDLSESIAQVYRIAADALQNAFAADGVVLVDDTPPRNARAHDLSDRNQQTVSVSPHRSTASAGSSEDFASRARTSSQHSACACIAASFGPGQNRVPEELLVTQSTLSSLSRNYPDGKIWRISQEEEESDTSNASTTADDVSAPMPAAAASGRKRPPLRPTNQSSRQRLAQHAAAVRRSFPTARSIMFLPLWKSSSNRRRCGVFIYLSARMRFFSPELDLQFLRTFCDVVMAEIARLDTQYVLHSKSTFVESVSHELRTPLHGILGTVEYLREHIVDAIPNRLVSQIEFCGQTMLETINQVLDFAHVDRAGKQGSILISSDEETGGRLGSSPEKRGAVSPFSLTSQPRQTSDLDRITEHATDSAVHAFHWRHSAGSGSSGVNASSSVTTILEVHHDLGTDWSSALSAGSWKRICMNLIGNALKYTSDGYIHITLQPDPQMDSGPDSPKMALLTITDTGRGMSPAFMQTSLFKPFEQEDSVADGTGLGLSLVTKLLKTLGGQIRVESTQGVGTTVFVSVPLSIASPPAQPAQSSAQPTEPRSHVPGKEPSSEAAVVAAAAALDVSTPTIPAAGSDVIITPYFSHSLDETDEKHDVDDRCAMVRSQGRRILRGALNRAIAELSARLRGKVSSAMEASINLVLDEDLVQLGPRTPDDAPPPKGQSPLHPLASDRPCIILCETFQRLHKCMAAVAKLHQPCATHVEYVVQPYGPMQLSNALIGCIRTVVPMLPSEVLTSMFHSSLPQYPGAGWRRSATIRTGGSALTPDSSGSNAKGGPQDGYFSYRSRAASKGSERQRPSMTSGLPSFFNASSGGVPFQPTPALTPTQALSPVETPRSSNNMQQTMKLPLESSDVPPEQLTKVVSAVSRPPSEPLSRTRSPATREDLLLLLVDDNHVNMRLLTMFADRQRFRHVTAENGQLAVDVYRDGLKADHQTFFDASSPAAEQLSDGLATKATSLPQTQCPLVILMDISMPVMDGFEATRQIRTLEAKTPGAPRALIIAMTGLGRDTAEQEARAAGMDHFMTKPVRMKELSALLDKLVLSPSSPTSVVSGDDKRRNRHSVVAASAAEEMPV